MNKILDGMTEEDLNAVENNMKQRKNTYMGNFGKEIELTKEEYRNRWNEVARDCSRLISWRDMQYTTKRVEIIQAMILKLADYNFDLKADDVSIHYDSDGNINSHRIGDKRII